MTFRRGWPHMPCFTTLGYSHYQRFGESLADGYGRNKNDHF
jgi:hypothetical protein